MPGLMIGYIRVARAELEGRIASFFHDSCHPMLRPDSDPFARVLALVALAAGAVAIIRRGERPAEPDDAAG